MSTDDEEEFRNRTLRFTNNNFVGKGKDSSTAVNNIEGTLQGWNSNHNAVH